MAEKGKVTKETRKIVLDSEECSFLHNCVNVFTDSKGGDITEEDNELAETCRKKLLPGV